MSEYPEHDKLKAVSDKSQIIGEFLEWLPYNLCEYHEDTQRHVYVDDRDGTEYTSDEAIDHCDEMLGRGESIRVFQEATGFPYNKNKLRLGHPEGHYPLHKSINELLGDYFEIDQNAIDREKKAMMRELRSKHETPGDELGRIMENI